MTELLLPLSHVRDSIVVVVGADDASARGGRSCVRGGVQSVHTVTGIDVNSPATRQR